MEAPLEKSALAAQALRRLAEGMPAPLPAAAGTAAGTERAEQAVPGAGDTQLNS